MEQIGAAPGVYDTPPLAGQAQPTQGMGHLGPGFLPSNSCITVAPKLHSLTYVAMLQQCGVAAENLLAVVG